MINRQARILLPLIGLVALPGFGQSADLRVDELRKLINQIATTGDRATADLLIDAYVAPLDAALKDVADRPYAEQLRVVEALARVTANIRIRLVRTELEEKDRESFDRIFSRERQLVEDLFNDSDEVRMAALNRVPLEKNTMAGILIAAKLRDWNAEITALALEKALKLSDDSVVRGVRKFARDVLILIGNNEAGLADPYVAIAYASFLDRAVLILARNGDKEDIPLLIEAIQQLNGEGIRRYALELRDTVDAIGEIGDEQLAPILLPLLSYRDTQRLPSLENGTAVSRTTGDAALAALAKIYHHDLAELGFVRHDETQPRWGFTSDEARTRAHLIFREWYRENADRPAADRAPLSATPAEAEKKP